MRLTMKMMSKFGNPKFLIIKTLKMQINNQIKKIKAQRVPNLVAACQIMISKNVYSS